MTVSPVLSFTVPFTVTFCADTLSDIKATNRVSSAVRMVFILLDILSMLLNKIVSSYSVWSNTLLIHRCKCIRL